ncbi:MAG TPA: HAMP domain-containing sensor histidine kinase [Candidatus Dormibacteraeota bacterium]|jgi:two-component system OmpR family sensor kinase
MMPPRLRWRLRSLRWRLTTFYVGLLSVLLLLGGVAQYFAAREVLFRSNADVLISEYTAVAQAFRKQLATRPAGTPTPIRALLLSQQFATELRSRRISAAIFDTNGGQLAAAPSTLGTGGTPTLRTADYLDALRGTPKPYYVASTLDNSTSYLVVLNVIKNGTRSIGLAQLAIPTDDIDRTLRLDREVAIVASLLVLVLALVLSPLIVGRALQPLEQMSRSAAALAAGDYKQRVPEPNTADEIGALAAAFNRMAAGIDQAFEVRRQSEDRMRQFVADASHELRTPLTSIAGYIDVLSRRHDVDLGLLQSSLQTMGQETARMTRLVNDLLMLTRYESRAATNRQPIVLDAWLNETLNEINLGGRGATESRSLESGLAVDADPEALKQVVQNLAQNALKYAPGAEQRWSAFRESGAAVIRLEDTGPGIPADDLPRVFERFYRGAKARDRTTGGSGLGLAIAKSIVEAHGGRIEAASGPGRGATFTVRLPLAGGRSPGEDR